MESTCIQVHSWQWPLGSSTSQHIDALGQRELQNQQQVASELREAMGFLWDKAMQTVPNEQNH